MTEPSQDPLRDEASAIRWLEGLINRERRASWSYPRLSLAPIESLLAALGHPERGQSVVHIAGSKGKGSTALLLEAVLRACGRRVGTFTSPHLERWTERFRIGGEEVPSERLVAAVERVRGPVEALRRDPSRMPSFFDATTAVAWCLFEEAQVDHVVLEVGLGGRLDSTNAVAPAVTCITSIELEHTDKLGDSLAAIASEKAGILKPGVPAVVGELPEEALTVVEARAGELLAPLERPGPELDAELPLLGRHQRANAALALACARRLLAGQLSRPAIEAAARRAFAAARLPGRIELLCREPRILIDSAHTEASAQALAEVLRAERGRLHLVLSISADKHVEAVLAALLPHASRATITQAEPTRSMQPDALADLARAHPVQIQIEPDPEVALHRARAGLHADETLCVAGSIYLAGIARRVLAAD